MSKSKLIWTLSAVILASGVRETRTRTSNTTFSCYGSCVSFPGVLEIQPYFNSHHPKSSEACTKDYRPRAFDANMTTTNWKLHTLTLLIPGHGKEAWSFKGNFKRPTIILTTSHDHEFTFRDGLGHLIISISGQTAARSDGMQGTYDVPIFKFRDNPS